jgi:C-terminal processing protease CtpA/Prc
MNYRGWKVVVETRGRREKTVRFTQTSTTPQSNYPIIALVNEHLPCASEILPVLCRMWDKAW